MYPSTKQPTTIARFKKCRAGKSNGLPDKLPLKLQKRDHRTCERDRPNENVDEDFPKKDTAVMTAALVKIAGKTDQDRSQANKNHEEAPPVRA